MTGALAIFVKTPGFSPVKTRLAQAIGQDSAEIFFKMSIKVIEEVALKIMAHSETDLRAFWAVAEEEAQGEVIWKSLPALYTGDGDLGERLHHIYSQLLEQHDFVILIGADSPQISPGRIQESIDRVLKTEGFVMGPAVDGGFYLFGGKKSIPAKHWINTSYSTDSTAQELINRIRPLGPCDLLEVMHDVDTIADLNCILPVLKKCKLESQKKLSAWIQQLLNEEM